MSMVPRSLTLSALAGLPLVNPGHDLGTLLIAALRRAQIAPRDKDVIIVAQKIVSKAEGRFVDLKAVVPSARAAALAQASVIAVSPIIRGQAVKGPTAKMVAELGIAITNESIAENYCLLIDGLVPEEADAADRERIDVPALVTRTMMNDIADCERLAGDIVAFASKLAQLPAVRLVGGRR
jgi:hypothetical protein